MQEEITPLDLWSQDQSLGWQRAGEIVQLAEPSFRGLFWTDRGVQWRVTQWALITLYSYAYLLDGWPFSWLACHTAGATIRGFLDTRRDFRVVAGVQDPACGTDFTTIGGTEGGYPIVDLIPITSSTKAANYPGDVARICRRVVWAHGATADLHLWWARRLYAWGERCNSDNHLKMAELCARLALTEIGKLAAIILHEILHDEDLTGGGHCLRNRQPKDCCNYVVEFGWYFLFMAELGLPLTREELSQVEEDNRFADPTLIRLERRALGICSDRSWVGTQQCNWLDPRHPARISWNVGPNCASGASIGLQQHEGSIEVNEVGEFSCLNVAPHPL